MNEIVTNIISYVLAPAGSAIIGWLVGRRKMLAEAATNELENVSKALAIYQDMIKDLQGRQEEMRQQIRNLEQKLRDSETENRDLKRRIRALEQKNNHEKG